MEQKLLLDLAASEGNLLENKALIDSLNTLKSASVAIQEKLFESSQLQLSLDGQREVFRPIAKTGSLLFFTLLDLQRINSMYKYSLPMFLRLFHQALDSRQLGHAPPADRTRLLSPLLQQLALFALGLASLFVHPYFILLSAIDLLPAIPRCRAILTPLAKAAPPVLAIAALADDDR